MQAYPGRDPLAEYLAGQITLRKLRVMVEHLPQDNAWWRDANGPWTDLHHLLHDIDSQLRNLAALTRNIHRGKDTAALLPEYLPKPQGRLQREAVEHEQEQQEQERASLLATLSRTSTND